MLTGKQKSYLKALANEIDPVVQIGKGGISSAVLSQVDEALEARELIKVRVLQNSLEEPKEAAVEIAKEVSAELVQVIGRNILLYRSSKKKPVIELP
ncbi:MAG: ribosome assembly RNA-binding protein YhbY [Zhaonellaceae bacterium]|jgi:RNA-binding protein|nr:ribosome assembly RNA-binding protein YhbY [Clostridia bacterium]